MIVIDDRNITDCSSGLELVNTTGTRKITHAIHDIDGTYSLIRQWRPVMSRSLWHAMSGGLKPGYDSAEMVSEVSAKTGSEPLTETDSFCVESAGLSALTQMEWAIRRGIEMGTVSIPDCEITALDQEKNSQIIKRIWQGEEVFDQMAEREQIQAFLVEHTPRLFRLYEQVLNNVCRDTSLALARQCPDNWLVPGSHRFMNYLFNNGVINYFVTGAVIDLDADGRPLMQGMYEEVLAVGFDIGPGLAVEKLYGSTWDRKVPKREVVGKLSAELGVKGENILIVGDGRAEISAGVEIGAVTLSRIPVDAPRDREIHLGLGTNYIVADFTAPELYQLFSAE